MRVTYKSAVVAKCKECIYDPMSGGTWRQQVTACTSKTCPLYPVRPQDTKKRSTDSSGKVQD